MKIKKAELKKTIPGMPRMGKAEGTIVFTMKNGNSYETVEGQKPLYYGYPMVVFYNNGPSFEEIKPILTRRGAFSQSINQGSNPGADYMWPLATKNKTIVKIVEAAIAGKIPIGPINVEEYE